MLTIIYDLETTGFSGLPLFSKAHQILQICAHCIENGKTFESYVRPLGLKEIPPQSTLIHKIETPGDKDIIQVFNELIDFFGKENKFLFVAHNNNYFDELILRRHVKICDNISFFDSLPYLREKLPNKESYALGNLYENLYGKKLENAHNAISDVLALAEIFKDFIKIDEEENRSAKRRKIESIKSSCLTSIRYVGEYRAKLIFQNVGIDNKDDFRNFCRKKKGKNLDNFLKFDIKIRDVTQRRFIIAEMLELPVYDDEIMKKYMITIHNEIEYYTLFRFYPELMQNEKKNIKKYNRGLFLLKNLKN